MTNKEAIEELKPLTKYSIDKNGIVGTFPMVHRPSQVEALNIAIKAIEEQLKCGCNICEYYPMKDERPTGKRIFDAEHSITIDLFKCSVCGSGGHVHFKYCPNCGAKMEA